MLSNYTPAFVTAYDQATKLARVRIPGLTDGADEFPQAMLCYPIGDKGEHTDIRILVGDRVWVDFVNGDPRFPIIVGFRPKETDNAIDVRRMHHKNMEFTADTDLTVTATGGTVLIKAGTLIKLQAPAITLDGPTTVTGLFKYLAGSEGHGSSTSNGKDVSDQHGHTLVKSGTNVSGPVQ